MLNLSGTWNTTGIANGIRLNVVDSASNASSLLADFQIAGSSRFSVTKTGSLTVGTGGATASFIPATAALGIHAKIALNGVDRFLVSTAHALLPAAHLFGWVPSTTLNTTPDLALYRDAANTLAQRNGTAANTLRVYGTFSSASDYRRLGINSTTAGVFTLSAEGAGTGASGNILKLTAPVLIPAASVTLATNGDLAFEATSNTTLTIRYRGSDGTTRSAAITLA